MENFKTDFEKTLKEGNLSEKEIAFKNLNPKEFSKSPWEFLNAVTSTLSSL